MLDPRIGLKGVELDYEGDIDLEEYLQKAKTELEQHFRGHYQAAKPRPLTPAGSSTSVASTTSSSTKYDFTSRYKQRDCAIADELQEFWRLEPEDFNTTDPISWWYSRRHQFPTLYRLALDILSIPGSAVAVERIFSAGRDTISMRRASLKPETISTLMTLKQYIRAGYHFHEG